MVGFTDLPSELVLHIIDLAEASFVDNETFPISDGRKATLLRFSRVSRAWRAPSQMALHRRVFLQNDADVNCFLACPIAGRYPTRYLQLTHVSPTRINLVLDQLVVRDTNRIALHGLTLIEVSEFHTWSLCHPALRDLKSLQIDGHGRGLMGRLPRDLLNLPHLHSLGFVTSIPRDQPGVMETIISACQKTLRHIRVDCGLQSEELSPVYPGPGTPSLWAELDLVAPRLLSVSFQGLSDALTKPCKRFLAKCSNLVELELDGTALIVPTLCALSPDARLRRLAVGQHNHDTQKDLDPGQAPKTVLRLKGTLPQLSQLRELDLFEHTRMTVRRMQRSGDMEWLNDLRREQVDVQIPEPINERTAARSGVKK
ncbi:hypothetical protein MVLG_03386 [Microbotryum lychnidis-dioicae p1A1 Lamole]|uniref:F-box domain-containing protein n=1 Tax=Microbotryum lychnidis-dioicae (strain p1A1 Lamole / MvSl-1064) TaxID=683840 RepID=U5H819_USTV1|nr:hypothetical protein MVLG_03386 [Microbotryum lychnidis-dioicae p1A1 Lamole]|eukprot:KDE06227.1 hypothetical protein MVLG_03386 [Microbotryum lychnidis-dioicae p1A1 Lamole]